MMRMRRRKRKKNRKANLLERPRDLAEETRRIASRNIGGG